MLFHSVPRPTGISGSNEPYNLGMVTTHGLETSHADTFSNISREGTLMVREVSCKTNTSMEHLQEVLPM